jgi:hypothetical protein
MELLMAKAPNTEISEAKIRNAIWYLKTGKTKKFVCEFLGITYNTKKLDSLIEDFHKRLEREKQLKLAAKNKVFSQKEKELIVKQYLAGEAQSTLAKQYFISPQRIKNILIEMNTPLRGRGKNSEGKVDHIIQDLETKFKKGDKVFIAKYNCFASIHEIFDEEYLEYLENGRQRYVETYPFKPDKNGMSGKHIEPVEGIHYEIYWALEDGKEIKLSALKHVRNSIMKSIEETGREYYLVWREGEESAFYYANREELYPVKAN